MTLYSQQRAADSANQYTATRFLVQQILAKVQTATLVQVKGVTNSGGVSAVGTVDVLPLVNQMTANRQPVAHGIIYGIPYLRIQGGSNAVILDPQVGDLGICVFASRDISSVKASKAVANPGSGRSFDWADGLYLGGVLNGVPTQYVAFAASGMTLHSPTKITLSAPTVEIDASTALTITAGGATLTSPTVDIEASTSATINSPLNDIKGGGTKIDGKTFLTHDHTGVQSGGSNTGPVG